MCWYWHLYPTSSDQMILAVVTSRYLWPLKVKIWNQVNKSCEVSNHRFLSVPISFWDAFLTSDDHRGCDLQISMTSGGKNMKWMKISHARSQIIGFLVFRFNSETLFRSHGHRGLDQILMTFRGPTMKKNVNSAFYYHCFSESNPKHMNLRVLNVFHLRRWKFRITEHGSC